MKEKVGVTGASGYLGLKLCDELVKKGYAVKGLFNQNKPPLNIEGACWIQGNILRSQDVQEFIAGCDFVIHCAALISIAGDQKGKVWETNVVGTDNIISACLQEKVKRLIYVSSTHAVKETPKNSPLDESRPYKDKNDFAYDYSKATAEQLVLKAVDKDQLNAVVVRPSGIIGFPDFRPSLLGQAIINLYKGKIPVLPQGGYNYVDLENVTNSIIASLKKGGAGEVYLLSGKYYNMREFSQILGNVTGRKMPWIVLPSWILLGVLPFVFLYSLVTRSNSSFTYESIITLKNGHQDIKHDKASDILGHSCKPLSASLEELINWFQKEKLI
jgi:dihydroflavonol-4-reductase